METARASERPRHSDRGQEIGAPEVAFHLYPAVPRLRLLACEVQAGDPAPGTRDPPVERRAGVEAITRLVAVLVGREHEVGEAVDGEADLPEPTARGQADDGIPGPRPELDVLMGQSAASELEGIALGASERDRAVAARRHCPRAEASGAMQEQPRITGAAERLVAVMDAAVGDHDGLVLEVLEADARPHPPPGNDRLHPETTSQARLGDEGDLGDRQVLLVEDGERLLVHRHVLVVDPGADEVRGRAPSTRLGRSEGGPADRQVRVRSAGSAGFGPGRGRGQDEGESGGGRDVDEPQRVTPRALSSLPKSAPTMSVRLPAGSKTIT